MVGLSPHSIVEKSQEKNKKNGDPKNIFFKSGTTDHLNSDSYQTVPGFWKMSVVLIVTNGEKGT